jgi:hypothetical protein
VSSHGGATFAVPEAVLKSVLAVALPYIWQLAQPRMDLIPPVPANVTAPAGSTTVNGFVTGALLPNPFVTVNCTVYEPVALAVMAIELEVPLDTWLLEQAGIDAGKFVESGWLVRHHL